MKRIIIVVFILLGTGTLTSQNKKEVRELKDCLQPWLDGLDYMVRKDPANRDISYLKKIVDSGSIHRPTVMNGKRSSSPITQNKGGSEIALLPLCSEQNLDQPWQAFINNLYWPALYEQESNRILFRGDLPIPILARGLIFLHELRRWQRYRAGDTNAAEIELDAYEFEFAILDKINPPGYMEFMRKEIVRIRQEQPKGYNYRVNIISPIYKRMFPDLEFIEISAQIVAKILLYRAVFKMYEMDYKGPKIRERKLYLSDMIVFRSRP